MKNLFLLSAICLMTVFSCSESEMPVTSDDAKQWGEFISLSEISSEQANPDARTKNHDEDIVLHALVLKSDTLFELINSQVIAEIPVVVEGGTIFVYNDLLEEFNPVKLFIREDGSLENQLGLKFPSIEKNTIAISDKKEVITKSLEEACIDLCKAVHRALGVPRFLDSICCFWWPNSELTYDSQL